MRSSACSRRASRTTCAPSSSSARDVAAVDIFAGNLRNLLLAAPLGSASVIGVDPGPAHRLQVRRDRRDRQVPRHRHDLHHAGRRAAREGEGRLRRVRAASTSRARSRSATAPAAARPRRSSRRRSPRPACARARRAVRRPGQRGRRERLLGVGPRARGVPRARPDDPRRDLDRAAPAGSARRARQDRAEVDRRRPVPARRPPAAARKKLGDVVESCVNHVGVELNTASAQLLGYVAGIGKSLAKKIVAPPRHARRVRVARSSCRTSAGLGPKAFEQAAGFLRIRGAREPARRIGGPPRALSARRADGDRPRRRAARADRQPGARRQDRSRRSTSQGDVGEPTLRDIVAELEKPGRDPRAEFAPPKFRDDVTTMEDLKPGMVLEGVVTNVTAFGAFVDIGVHNDGLVHVSQLAEQFVKDPSRGRQGRPEADRARARDRQPAQAHRAVGQAEVGAAAPAAPGRGPAAGNGEAQAQGQPRREGEGGGGGAGPRWTRPWARR